MFVQKTFIATGALALILISGCSNIKTEPADDGYDTLPANGGQGYGTKPPEPGTGWLDTQIAAALGNNKKSEKENEELRKRLERLENAQQGQPQTNNVPNTYQRNPNDITSPPVGGSSLAPSNVGGVNWQNSASYQEWKRAKEGGTSDYKEFQEYKDWLEFQKIKEQNK